MLFLTTRQLFSITTQKCCQNARKSSVQHKIKDSVVVARRNRNQFSGSSQQVKYNSNSTSTKKKDYIYNFIISLITKHEGRLSIWQLELMWTFYSNTHTAYHSFLFVDNCFHTYPKKKNNRKSNHLWKSKKAVQSHHIFFQTLFVYLASANLTLSRQAHNP